MQKRGFIHTRLRPLLRPLMRSPHVRGAGGFSPAQISFTSGLWLDESDITTGFQDSAGTTPQTASGQLTGLRVDKSGRANNFLQASASPRPEWDVITGISSDFFDGVDDNLATGTFVAGTLTNNMDFFCAIKRSTSAGSVLMANAVAGSQFFGSYNASAGITTTGVGAAFTNFVNNVSVPDDRTLLNTALTVGAWKIFEVRNLDLSAMTKIGVSLYGSGLFFAGDIGGIILCPAQSAAIRNNIRTWLGAKVGLSL